MIDTYRHKPSLPGFVAASVVIPFTPACLNLDYAHELLSSSVQSLPAISTALSCADLWPILMVSGSTPQASLSTSTAGFITFLSTPHPHAHSVSSFKLRYEACPANIIHSYVPSSLVRMSVLSERSLLNPIPRQLLRAVCEGNVMLSRLFHTRLPSTQCPLLVLTVRLPR